MITFDQILPIAIKVLTEYQDYVKHLDWLLVNRDLYGRVRFIAPEKIEESDLDRAKLETIYKHFAGRIEPHGYPIQTGILYETKREPYCEGTPSFKIDGFNNIWIVDRLATESNWARIAPENDGVPRIVFFSIKGGVGRSTALAAAAWTLAQAGKRVLVLDLDLESPGLSSSLLSPDRQPQYGITDWLVEDLVGNTQIVLESMVASSGLSHDGEIYVAPAHGAVPGEYIAKLGRVWMPKVCADGSRELWSTRLQRLLKNLEERFKPDVVLIDSRAGIDEVASSCVTDLGATLVLLFALEGSQTWTGYRILFEHWQRAGVARDIRERLKIVAAVVPELERVAYLESLREHAYEIFVDSLYDEILAPSPDTVGPSSDEGQKWRVGQLIEGWNFDEADEGAPHYPLSVNWHRSFAGLRSLQGRLAVIDAEDVRSIFGQLLDGVSSAVGARSNHG
jgi:hypothetical protein